MSRFSPLPLIFILFLLAGPALARYRHVINLRPAADLRPSTLAWDPSSQHFLVGSANRPVIYSVSDAGVVQTLVSYDPVTSAAASVSAIAVDDSRRRLIAAFSSPASISSYDLRSPVPQRRIFSSPLPEPSASITGVTVEPSTGTAFVATSSGQIFALDLDGKVSSLAQVSSEIGGAVHVSKGYLLVVEKEKGGIFKVDAEDGVTRRVLISAPPSPAAETVAIRSDGAAVLVGGGAARWVKSDDGWAEAAVNNEFKVEKGETIKGVAIREGRKVYVLVVNDEDEDEEGQNGKTARIQEVEWEKEEDGEMVWAMVLVGLGLAYFMYWRFQMGKLVSNLNKKSS